MKQSETNLRSKIDLCALNCVVSALNPWKWPAASRFSEGDTIIFFCHLQCRKKQVQIKLNLLSVTRLHF